MERSLGYRSAVIKVTGRLECALNCFQRHPNSRKSQNGKHERSSAHLDVRLTAWRYADVWEPILALLFVVIAAVVVVVVLQSSPIICINCLHIIILEERLDRDRRLAAAPLHFLHIHSEAHCTVGSTVSHSGAVCP